MTGYIIIAVLAMMLGIVALFSQDMVFTEKALFVCMALVMDSLCIFLCYIVNKTFNIEPIKYLYKYLDDIQREYKFKGEKLSNAEQIYYYVNNYNNWNDFSM